MRVSDEVRRNFTSHSRKDLVLTKLARLGQKVSPVQKSGCGTVMMSMSISPGSHRSWRVRSLAATSCLSAFDSLESKSEKITSSPLRKVRWDSLLRRAEVATTGHSYLMPLSLWMAVMRFLGALGAYMALSMKGR